MKIKLYISLYHEKNESRKKEILYSLKKNIDNKFIDEIIILNEGFGEEILKNKKIKIIPRIERPTFADFEQYLDPNAINIIVNNDIWFDNSVKKIKWLLLHKGDFLSLTRYEKDGVLFRKEWGDSQDSWIFKGIPTCLRNCSFYMGKLGCDNKINYIFYKAGYRVLNPSRVIRSIHEHQSNFRTYTEADRINGEYLYAYPINFFQFHISRFILFILNRMKLNYIVNSNEFR